MVGLIRDLLAVATREIMIFAGVGLLIGGLDDLAVDLIWLTRAVWRRATVYRRHPRCTAATLPPSERPGRIAVFVPAWGEADVIGTMLRTALARIDHPDYRLYVGTYPNDPATGGIVAAIADPRLRHVVGPRPGPTTKADCLNVLWHALRADEEAGAPRCKAVVLHDAEDVVHPAELILFDRLVDRFDLVQLPVLPLIDGRARWVSGHYADEFAEAHSRALVVREALGAALPSAGVGCALARPALDRLAHAAQGGPFDETSLVEDYEIGLRLGRRGRAAFVVMPAAPGAGPVAVRALFPSTFATAVRQKTRWLTGIALAGWDRLGWAGGVAEGWMRLRDRRVVLAALVLAANYTALGLALLCLVARVPVAWPGWARWMLGGNGLLMMWRLALRGVTVGHLYGWREGVRAVPRTLVANAIAMAAAARALAAYVPGAAPVWDKTAHRFPDTLPCE